MLAKRALDDRGIDFPLFLPRMTWLRIILRVSASALSVDVLTMKGLDLESEPMIASCQSHDEQLNTKKFQGGATCLLRLQRCSRHDHKIQ